MKTNEQQPGGGGKTTMISKEKAASEGTACREPETTGEAPAVCERGIRQEIFCARELNEPNEPNKPNEPNELNEPEKRKYRFYGWENADVPAVGDFCSDIGTPRELYDVLSELWCEETCAPRMRDGWSPENRTLGQCSITAFLAQDIFGGKVFGVPLSDGNFHCYNVVGDCVFDLTSEQFTDRTLCYRDNPEQFRDVHFIKAEKKARYEYLKRALADWCGRRK